MIVLIPARLAARTFSLIPPTGNTNTHGVFGDDVRAFLKAWVREGPTHHFALGIGQHAQTIAQIAECLNIENVIVRG